MYLIRYKQCNYIKDLTGLMYAVVNVNSEIQSLQSVVIFVYYTKKQLKGSRIL